MYLTQLDLVGFKNHQGGTCFEDMNRTWKAAEDLHCERPGKAIGEGTASVAVDSPGLKRSWKEHEVWCYKENLQKRLSLIAVEDPRVLEMSVVCEDHEEQKWQWSGVNHALF